MPPFDDLILANQEHAEHFAGGHLEAVPRRRLAVLTCMDCRIDVAQAFGLQAGDAHVLRNAGSRVTDDALRSLVKSTVQLGVDRVAVVHHTDCGAAKIGIETLRQRVVERTGNDPVSVKFHLIDDPAIALVADVDRLRTSPYLPPGTAVAGFVYDVATGRLALRMSSVVGGELVLEDASTIS